MPNLDLLDVLAAVFRCERASLADDADILSVPGWDSLTHMDMVLTLEREYGLQFTGDEIAELRSVAAIRSHLRDKGVTA